MNNSCHEDCCSDKLYKGAPLHIHKDGATALRLKCASGHHPELWQRHNYRWVAEYVVLTVVFSARIEGRVRQIRRLDLCQIAELLSEP